MTRRAKEVARVVQRLGVEDSMYGVREVARRSSLPRLCRLFARFHPAPRQDTPPRPTLFRLLVDEQEALSDIM